MKQESRYYVGDRVDGLYGRAGENAFITETGSRRAWWIVIALLLVVALVAGIAVTAKVKAAAAAQRLYDTPLEAASAEITKTLNALDAKRAEVLELSGDEAETARALPEYEGGTLAAEKGWTGDELKDHFTVFYVDYMAQYDASRSILRDGETSLYYILMQDADGLWEVVDVRVAPAREGAGDSD